uniref:Recep_L_domain domain-containing protein n=1 Tax=Haemonchus contortus TaxID=6289 RepID=A0A7I4YWC3_HAECO
MRNMFLQRIDTNENLILNGAYFIRKNAEEVEIYSGGNPSSTFEWNDPEDCLPDDPEHLLVHCKNIIGSVSVNRLSPAMNMTIRDFTGIKKIHGQLIISPADINSTTILTNYEHLEIVAHYKDAVIIENNKYLYGIEALTQMRVTPPENFPKEALKGWKPFVLRKNGKICGNPHYEKKLQEIVSSKVELSDYCKKRCAGGIVTDLTRLQSCQIVMGGLTIKDYDFESSRHLLRHFEKIEDVEGQLIIVNNTGIENLAFFKSLFRISDYTTKRPIFRVADNPNLTSIEPLHKVELEYSHYEVPLAALIETYSKISDHEQKELGTQGKVEFRVKERLHPTKGRRSKRKRDRKENADNLGVGIALSVGGCLIIIIFGYGYSFFAYLREQRELKRQQPGGGQAASVERAP